MTLSTVAVDDPVLASRENQIIASVNGSPGRAVFTANGTWSIPNGVHKFKISVCGGGGYVGDTGSGGGGEDVYSTPGGPGGISPFVSALISGQEIGTTFSITVGAGGTSASGGTSSFGTLLSVTGGGKGGTGPSSGGGSVAGAKGAEGTASGSAASGSLKEACPYIQSYPSNVPQRYGEGAPVGGTNGAPGIVVIEW